MVQCPLSGDHNLEAVMVVRTAEVAAVYRAHFGTEVGPLFHGIEQLTLYRSGVSDLMFLDPPVTGNESFYKQLSLLDWYYSADKYEFDFARRLIPDSARVLEVGCGPGFFGESLEGREYLGLEFNPDARAKAVARGLAVEGCKVEEVALREPASFDCVVSFQVLEHVADPLPFLESCARLVKPGGRLIVSVPSADSFMRFNLNDVLNMPPHHVTWWTDRCLSWCADRIGLRVEELHHQTLSDGGHRQWFLQQFSERALLKYLGIAPRGPMVDMALQGRLRTLSTALSQILEFGFEDPVMEPRGHTVIAVMTKAAGDGS